MMLGMILLWPIFMLLFLAFPVALAIGAYLLYRKAQESGALTVGATQPAAAVSTRACPSCGRFLQDGWVKCPYCGADI